MIKFLLVGMVASLMASALWAQTESQTQQPEQEVKDVMCKNGKFVRSLAVKMYNQKKECATTYTKAGVERKVGWGQNPRSCLEVLGKLQEVLEKNSWACRDISSVKVSDTGN